MGNPKEEPQHQLKPREPVPFAGNGGQRRMRTMTVTVATLAVAVFYFVWTSLSTWPNVFHPKWFPNGAKPAWDDNFVDWDAILPSEDLSWEPCFRALDEFYCARLTVPLDYGRPLDQSPDNPKVHLALVILPGSGHSPATGTWSESPLLLNPGGPGGSGAAIVLTAGRLLQTVVGAHHDIIGFDPRGIGASTPVADCFVSPLAAEPPNASDLNTALLHRLTWLMGDVETGLPNTSDAATIKTVARRRAANLLCRATDRQDGIFGYAGTPHVAHDMLNIVRAWDRWTDGARRKAGGRCPHARERAVSSTGLDEAEEAALPPSTRGKLVYWGFSYGTVLGATFASMFPESVGRMVLDGVVNTDEWFFDNSWINAAEDSDKVLDRFFYYCHAAKERCHIWRKGDDVDDLKRRYESIMAELQETPRPVINSRSHIPNLVTYSDIKRLTFAILYSPTAFRVLSLVLDVIERGNGLGELMNSVDLAPMCTLNSKLLFYPSDGGLAVMCSDQQMKVNDTKAGLGDLWERMANVSSFADMIFDISTRCVGWDIGRKDPPSFDWGKLGNATTSGPLNTSFPLLFVSNTRDPITPKRSGLHQARKFAGAGFVEQVSEGHCSIAAASLCTMRNIAGYLNHGIVPSPPRFDDDDAEGGVGAPMTGKWTVCEADDYPWKQSGTAAASGTDESDGFSEQDVVRIQAMRELQVQFRGRESFVQPPRMFEHLFRMDDRQLDELAVRIYSRRSSEWSDGVGGGL